MDGGIGATGEARQGTAQDGAAQLCFVRIRPPHWLGRAILAAILGLSAWIAGPTLAAEPAVPDSQAAAVVISGEKGALTPGTLLRADSRVSVQAGASLRLVDRSGSVVVIEGPYSGPLAAKLGASSQSGSDAAFKAVAALLAESVVLRGVRSGAGPRPTSPWAVSVHSDGVGCAPAERLTLWRSEAAEDGQLEIDLKTGGRKARLVFGKGRQEVSIPASLFTDGATYGVSLDKKPVSLTLKIAPQPRMSAIEQAAWMATSGCKLQALATIDGMK